MYELMMCDSFLFPYLYIVYVVQEHAMCWAYGQHIACMFLHNMVDIHIYSLIHSPTLNNSITLDHSFTIYHIWTL